MKVLFLVATLALISIALWLHFENLHRFALTSARRYCQELDLQLLDQTLVLRGLRFGRSTSGSIAVVTQYGFEFATTGERRYKGTIALAGKKRLSIELEPHVV